MGNVRENAAKGKEDKGYQYRHDTYIYIYIYIERERERERGRLEETR